MRGQIEHLDGVPHVRYETYSYSRPEAVVLWWRLAPATNRVSDGDPCEYRGSGFWSVSNPRWGARTYRDGDGNTEAARREVRAVPPPQTRCLIRWKDGRWQKYLKARGWTDV